MRKQIILLFFAFLNLGIKVQAQNNVVYYGTYGAASAEYDNGAASMDGIYGNTYFSDPVSYFENLLIKNIVPNPKQCNCWYNYGDTSYYKIVPNRNIEWSDTITNANRYSLQTLSKYGFVYDDWTVLKIKFNTEQKMKNPIPDELTFINKYKKIELKVTIHGCSQYDKDQYNNYGVQTKKIINVEMDWVRDM
jgi:hypothetical protein